MQNPNADKQVEGGDISVAVSLGGTWQRRGYSSKYGVVVAILVATGEVVDFEVLSMHRHERRRYHHEEKDSRVFLRIFCWWGIKEKGTLDKCRIHKLTGFQKFS